MPARSNRVQGLPCVLRAPLQLLVVDMIREDDDFADAMRKVVSAVGLLVGTLIVPSILLGDPGSDETGLLLYNIARWVQSVCWIAQYLVIRFSCGVSPRTVLTVAFGGNLFALCGFSVTAAHAPGSLGSILSLFAVGLVYLPMRGLWIAGAFVPFGIASFNRAWSECTHRALLLDKTTAAQFGSQFLVLVIMYIIAAAVTLSVHAMHDEYARAIAGARASARLSARVAEKMARYDTDGARQLLVLATISTRGDDATAEEASSETPGGGRAEEQETTTPEGAEELQGADEKLVASLETIVSNLEAYRPHLPNWIIDSAPESTSDEGQHDFDDASSVRSSRSSLSSARVHTPRSPRSKQRRACRPGADPAPQRTARVVRARLNFSLVRGHGDSSLAIATAFVDGVHAAARGTKAAVHSFIGDAVEVSWNAASAAPAAKARSARFLARIRKAAAEVRHDDAHVTLGGGAIACRAKILVAGGGQQQALLVSIGKQNEDLLSTLADAGLRYRAMLADETIVAEAIDVRTCPVATVPTDEAGAEDRTFAPVCQVLDEFALAGEASGSAEHADWLYALQCNANTEATIPGCTESPPLDSRPMHVLVAQAFDAARQNRYARALQFLKHVPAEDLSSHPLVSRFLQATKRFAADTSPTPSAAAVVATAAAHGDTFDHAIALSAPAHQPANTPLL